MSFDPVDDDDDTGNDVVISKGPCPHCGGSKSLVVYADGHEHCYGAGCDHFKPATGATTGKRQERAGGASEALLDPLKYPSPFAALSTRRLDTKTLLKYGVFSASVNSKPVQVYPYFDMEGQPAGQKLRFPGKEFTFLKAEGAPGLAQCQLFGRQVYGDKYDRQVVITEGELDALSVAQAIDFKTAVVSVPTGSQSAAKALKANYLWLDRFKEIILWFDDDEAGRLAVAECAPLFKVGKVRLAKVNGYKDASDVLQANRPGDIQSAIYAAVGWRPAGIVNAADNSSDVTKPTEEDHAFSYSWPWPKVNDAFGPQLPGQVTYHVAGTGVGKSTALAEIEIDLLRQGAKIFHMGLEDTRRDAKLRLMTIKFGQRLDINPLSDEEMKRMHDELFGSRQVELFDPETAEWTLEALNGYIRYAAKGLDCQLGFIDPLTFLSAGLAAGEDERRALDSASRDVAAMSKELGIHLHIAHHLRRPMGTSHEEGAPTSLNEVRGSGGIANFATFVLGHERNGQASGDDWLLTQLRGLKNRPRSKTGVLDVLRYSLDTGRLTVTNDTFPEAGKGGGHQSKDKDGFAPVSDDY